MPHSLLFCCLLLLFLSYALAADCVSKPILFALHKRFANHSRRARPDAYIFGALNSQSFDNALMKAPLKIAGASNVYVQIDARDPALIAKDCTHAVQGGAKASLTPLLQSQLDFAVEQTRQLLTDKAVSQLFDNWESRSLGFVGAVLELVVKAAWAKSHWNSTSASNARLDALALTPPRTIGQFVDRAVNCSHQHRPLLAPEAACQAALSYDQPTVAPIYASTLLRELNTTLIDHQAPPRNGRDRALLAAYECGDINTLKSVLSIVGFDASHPPLNGTAGEMLDERALFARNRDLSEEILLLVEGHSSSSAPPLFVIDVANLLAPDRLGPQRKSLFDLLTSDDHFEMVRVDDNDLRLQHPADTCSPLVFAAEAPQSHVAPSLLPIYIAIVVVTIVSIVACVFVVRFYIYRRNVNRVLVL